MCEVCHFACNRWKGSDGFWVQAAFAAHTWICIRQRFVFRCVERLLSLYLVLSSVDAWIQMMSVMDGPHKRALLHVVGQEQLCLILTGKMFMTVLVGRIP